MCEVHFSQRLGLSRLLSLLLLLRKLHLYSHHQPKLTLLSVDWIFYISRLQVHPVGHISCSDQHEVRYPLSIYANVPFDTRHLFSCVIAFILCIRGIFHTLRVNNKKTCIFISSLLLSEFCDLIFLKPFPVDLTRHLSELHSSVENMNKRSATWENREGSSSTESLFSGHIGWHRKPHKGRQFEVSSFFEHIRAMGV